MQNFSTLTLKRWHYNKRWMEYPRRRNQQHQTFLPSSAKFRPSVQQISKTPPAPKQQRRAQKMKKNAGIPVQGKWKKERAHS
jgi:hypothetical protein